MSRKRHRNIRASDEAKKKKSAAFLTTAEAWDTLCVTGYTPLDRVPAIVSGYRRIAELIGSITIHLMENTENGDKRIINELSRKIDINPCRRMSRSTWMEWTFWQSKARMPLTSPASWHQSTLLLWHSMSKNGTMGAMDTSLSARYR